MKSIWKPLAAVTVVAGSALAGAAGINDYAQHELMVKFKPGTSSTTVNLVNSGIGARIAETLPRIGWQRISLPAGISVLNAVQYYKSKFSVAYAEPNYKKELCFTPNDTQFGSMWGMVKMKMPEGWDLGKGNPSVICAVIDTGIDLNHEDFVGKLVPGFDFSDNDSDPTWSDSHGVHTAGTVGAATNNGKGVAGVAFNCKVMPLKIFPNAFAATSANAITYAADHGAKVVSMSYGAYAFSQVEKDATEYAWSKGVVLVGGAGNDNTSELFYPNSYPRVIGVGSTGPTDQKSGFSNFGPDHVIVAAPGENILSTFPGNTYAAIDGTSMATPHVAGLATLLYSFAPSGTSAATIRSAIETTCDPVGNWVKFGRVNAQKAMKLFDVASEDVSNVVAVEPFLGSNPQGSVTDLTASDANYFTISSESQTAGQMAGDVVTLGVSTSMSNLRSAKLIVEANAPISASNQIYLWSFTNNRWEVNRASALRPTGANRVTLTLPNDLSSYVQGGEMKVLTRAIIPNRPLRGSSGIAPSFQFKLGFMQLRTRPAN